MRMGVFLMLLMCQVVSGQESWQLGGSDTTRHAEELRLQQEANAIQAQALMQQRAYMQQSLLLQQQQQQAFQQRQQETRVAPQGATSVAAPVTTERKVYVPGPTVYVPMGTPPEVLEKIKKLEEEVARWSRSLHRQKEYTWDAVDLADRRKYFIDDMKKRLREVLENRGTKEEFLKILDEKTP